MNLQIRIMREEDRATVKEMMRVFYASPAVHTNGSDAIFDSDIDACIGTSPYLDGYVFEQDGTLCGYAMVAKSFSTEFGRPCYWLEDLYMKEDCRGLGIGSLFFDFAEKTYPDGIFRLEVEEENEGAVRLYRRRGFTVLPYMEMVK